MIPRNQSMERRSYRQLLSSIRRRLRAGWGWIVEKLKNPAPVLVWVKTIVEVIRLFKKW